VGSPGGDDAGRREWEINLRRLSKEPIVVRLPALLYYGSCTHWPTQATIHGANTTKPKWYRVRSLAFSFACIAVTGCSSMHAQRVAGLLDPYVGQPVSGIVDRFGPPSGEFASSAVENTYTWDSFGAGQSGMTGCRVMVMASRGAGQDAAAATQAFGSDPISPEDYRQWTIKSWSSFGSGC
jgi:hypothetical protein